MSSRAQLTLEESGEDRICCETNSFRALCYIVDELGKMFFYVVPAPLLRMT